MCLGVIAACLSCKQSDDNAGPMPQPTKEPPPGFTVDTAKRVLIAKDAGSSEADTKGGSSERAGRPSLSAEALKGLKRSLPAMEHTNVLKALKVTPHSRVARMTLCVDKSVAETTSLFLRAYKRKKWTEITVHTPPHDDKRRSFTGNSKRFRMNGNTSQGDFESCKKSLKQTRVSLSFQERQPPAKTKPEVLPKLAKPLLVPARTNRIAPTPPTKSETKPPKK